MSAACRSTFTSARMIAHSVAAGKADVRKICDAESTSKRSHGNLCHCRAIQHEVSACARHSLHRDNSTRTTHCGNGLLPMHANEDGKSGTHRKRELKPLKKAGCRSNQHGDTTRTNHCGRQPQFEQELNLLKAAGCKSSTSLC